MRAQQAIATQSAYGTSRWASLLLGNFFLSRYVLLVGWSLDEVS